MRARTLTSRTLIEHFLERVHRLDPVLRSFLTVTEARALADADRADRELSRGRVRGPLHGIPYALKDIFDVVGIPTTCNSALTLHRVPDVDAAVEERLREGGGVLLGKLNTHEFALGGPSNDLPFPPARNPWHLDHFTGASSSGSGVAVAAGLVPVSIGSDTSGSIRGPAAHCGVAGLKPTYGLVSRRGAFPLSYALDHCGPFGRTVGDLALALDVVAGHDPLDPGSVRAARPAASYATGLDGGVAGLRVGYARELFDRVGLADREVGAAVDDAAMRLAALGAHVDQVTLPDFERFNACGRVLLAAEAYAVHEHDLRRRPEAFGRYTYQRVAPGATLTAADLLHAHRARRELAAAVARALSAFDVLLTANALTLPAKVTDFPLDWPPPSAVTATMTIPFNVTGHPALSVPVGLSTSGLPLAVQLVGGYFAETDVLRTGAALEATTGASARWPGIASVSSGGVPAE